jgi:hypothetical protein
MQMHHLRAMKYASHPGQYTKTHPITERKLSHCPNYIKTSLEDLVRHRIHSSIIISIKLSQLIILPSSKAPIYPSKLQTTSHLSGTSSTALIYSSLALGPPYP